jgi:tetratricopeptide (TPR) repeat protein
LVKIRILSPECESPYINASPLKAIADCNQALSLKPDYAGAYASRGRVRVALKDKKGAIEDYQKAAKLFLKEGNKRNYQGVQEDLKKLQD